MIQLSSSHLLSWTSTGRSAWDFRRYFQTKYTMAIVTMIVRMRLMYRMK